MKYLVLLSMLFYSGIAFSQDWGRAAECNINVKDSDPVYGSDYRRPAIDAVFTYNYTVSGCTGTLVNRATSDGNVGYYFLTAKHCTDEIDFSATQTLKFNYQSPDANTASTPEPNKGVYYGQSYSLTDQAHEYFHETKLKLINSFDWGDFALVQILTPLPPHFNYTYAGWNSSMFYNGVNLGTPGTPFEPFAGIHHPHQDIKKISTTTYVNWNTAPTVVDCYTITVLIDVLFGWIWGHRWSTQVICNYLESPWVDVFVWHHGTTEGGSSGSGLFNKNNNLIGVLHGSIDKDHPCEITGTDKYGKFHSNYFRGSIRNELNPDDDPNVDLFGLGSRKITCYDNLELPGAPGVSGQYFPAKDYQAENTIVLQANNDITTTQPIHIYSGADYRFRAGNQITLGPGFETEAGATFVGEIQACDGSKPAGRNSELTDRLKAIKIPRHMDFNTGAYLQGNLLESKALNKKAVLINMFPNPSQGDFTIKISSPGHYRLRIIDMVGSVIYTQPMNDIPEVTVHLSGVSSGNYTVEVSNETEKFLGKMVIVKN